MAAVVAPPHSAFSAPRGLACLQVCLPATVVLSCNIAGPRLTRDVQRLVIDPIVDALNDIAATILHARIASLPAVLAEPEY